jgi:hypothetical protein
MMNLLWFATRLFGAASEDILPPGLAEGVSLQPVVELFVLETAEALEAEFLQ